MKQFYLIKSRNATLMNRVLDTESWTRSPKILTKLQIRAFGEFCPAFDGEF